jgi:hypothetical protein
LECFLEKRSGRSGADNIFRELIERKPLPLLELFRLHQLRLLVGGYLKYGDVIATGFVFIGAEILAEHSYDARISDPNLFRDFAKNSSLRGLTDVTPASGSDPERHIMIVTKSEENLTVAHNDG